MTTAFLLGVALTALAWHVLGYLRWGSRPTDLEHGAVPIYRIDLNRADRAELLQLPGVGESMAARIEDRRTQRGPYRKVDDLRAVKRIGPATLERLRDWVEINGEESDDETDSAIIPAGHPSEAGQTAAAEKKAAARKKTPPSVPIDINRAGAEELQKLPDIGPSLAQAIIDARAKKPFEKVDDLTRVPGIKAKRLEALRPYVTVSGLATDKHR